ncbi:MAG TPA: glycoside hydrolase family 97 catalytic domain-containing protein [Anaerohalosphaeraceae bacterium]|mgnify:FL=1|nr:glycoside hydrolase family 97 catalytic domain-containing protein [Anaerohalosphaeraceae bacterium]
MKLRLVVCLFLGAALFQMGYAMERSHTIQSPDGRIQVDFLMEEGRAFYSVRLGKEVLLEKSPLGVRRSDADFTGQLTLQRFSKTEKVSDNYTMPHGKQSRIAYRANRRTATLANPQGQLIQIVFQVSDDGLAFRYHFPEPSGLKVSVEAEQTGFAFPSGTVSWLHPMHDAKTGWEKTQPSYEAHYEIEKPVGLPSPYSAGWVFPALFRVGQAGWVLLSETAVDENYCGCRLAQHSDGGVYRIAFPQVNEHRGPQDPVAPSAVIPFSTPWRLVIVGRDLGAIVESTLATDVAEPSKVKDLSFVRPGRAAWSWLRYDSEGTKLPYLQEYLEMAGKLGWEYMLVDADWDRLVGYEKIAELARQARQKGVELILWYNSNGEWNTAPMTPKNRVHLPDVRREEFARLRQMGIRGIKVDFFGGDKQAAMQLYQDILRDAAEYQLLANFHGATLPRGWHRTWPNLVTTEAVMGMEYCTFDQRNADRQAEHSCILPFTRNVVAPMDFTPVVMSRRIRGVQRRTTPAFEMALPVIFESGIQHFGLAPFEAEALPAFAVDYFKAVPTTWDETRFVSGYPAKEVVLARRKGKQWFAAGINGEKTAKTLTLDLSFLPKNFQGILITDGAQPDQLESKTVSAADVRKLTVSLPPQGGFVLYSKPR